MRSQSRALRVVLVTLIAVGCGLGSLFVAAALLVTLGVHLHDHEDYFSPFYYNAGTAISKILGGAVFFGAGILGFSLPLVIGLWRWK